MHLAQLIPLLIFVIFTSSVVRPSQKLVRQCSFTDEMSNFYASWHTNCSGLVSFVINAFNFPRPKVPFGNGLSDFSPYSHFWIGIGIRLVSTELIVVESQPNGAVLVSQARIEPNRPPQRQIGQGILLNPRGSFFGTTLEATFSIDESLLRGCKEFLFYTTPMPLDIPFANLPPPHIREICELGQMCAISACSPGKEEALTKQQKRSAAFGDGFSGPVGLMDFIGTGGPQDPTLPMTMMNDIGTMNRGMMGGYGNKFGPSLGYGGYSNPLMMMDAGRLGGGGGGYGYGPYNRGYGIGASGFNNPYVMYYNNGYGAAPSLPYSAYWPQSPALQYPMGGAAAQLQYSASQNPYSTAYWGGFLSPLKAKTTKKRMLSE
ncbi:hypothetical protein niasHS_006067 [Heterodera schachtii]|uniref:Uncharacterized protein n=1 Tax=Heterodera schachtii TaxID=97005 RepID=A0ABD2JVV4_HETSC